MWIFASENGRHVWRFLRGSGAESDVDGDDNGEAAAASFRRLDNPNVHDTILREQLQRENGFAPKVSLRQPRESRGLAEASDCLRAAADYYTGIQCKDGHWAGDYAGPMFLMTGLLIACRLTGKEFSPEERAAMRAYLRNVQSAEDGGWGLHIESKSTMFGTVLNYIALRLLGCPADDPDAARARQWIRDRGGAESCPSWGKFWMAVLGVYEYEGLHPVNPDLWLLPTWFPFFHPGRMWCHSRMVYLPMGYLYGHRVRGPTDDLVVALRDELYTTPYDSIDWCRARSAVYEADVYHPHHWVLKVANAGLALWEKIVPRWLRRRALDEAWLQICREDEWTNYYSIGPVNKMFNMVCHWHRGHTEGVDRHWDQVPAYMWVSEDGMKMSGQVGSQCWDTSFSVCAFHDTGLDAEYPEAMRRVAPFIDAQQMVEDMPDRERYYRSGTKGAWPFTVGAHGWAISDCTAEGFSAALALRQMDSVPEAHRVPRERLEWTVDLLLTEQNASGGWSSYEKQRGGDWYELINPSEVFGKIMVDYQYVECTASSVLSLRHFQSQFPDYRAAEIDAACARAARFIDSRQRDDGSFYGSWAVCFTYATGFFAIRGLIAAGRDPETCPTIRRACEYLVSRQREDGGWGEAFSSCEVHEYVEAPRSQVVNTAWAVMGLLAARWHDRRPVERAIEYLVREQGDDGSWYQEVISGVFNGSCAITYSNYAMIFPIWAIGLYLKDVAKKND